jgi:diaminohydroxyphosphoribosylaminopyrimidine deaminase/5-amino-6-(5-phosphoribosylamino)uracil reductase
MPDPNPEVAGQGAKALAEAGVHVAWAADPAPFERQNEAWLHRLRTGRPFVRAKVALTLDGRPTLHAGTRSRITGAGGSAITMRLRAEATAVAVGARTLAIDDPRLTVRDPRGVPAERQPRRVVLARTSMPAVDETRLHDAPGELTVVLPGAVLSEWATGLAAAGIRTLGYDAGDGLAGALLALGEDGVDDLLIEPGPSLFTALWSGRLIDELVVVTAGGMAGKDAPGLFTGAADAAGDRLAPVMYAYESGIADGDVVTVWRPDGASSPGPGKGSGT